jgi:positive regulator of sigma E activity
MPTRLARLDTTSKGCKVLQPLDDFRDCPMGAACCRALTDSLRQPVTAPAEVAHLPDGAVVAVSLSAQDLLRTCVVCFGLPVCAFTLAAIAIHLAGGGSGQAALAAVLALGGTLLAVRRFFGEKNLCVTMQSKEP